MSDYAVKRVPHNRILVRRKALCGSALPAWPESCVSNIPGRPIIGCKEGEGDAATEAGDHDDLELDCRTVKDGASGFLGEPAPERERIMRICVCESAGLTPLRRLASEINRRNHRFESLVAKPDRVGRLSAR
jgi:hypothetical protein